MGVVAALVFVQACLPASVQPGMVDAVPRVHDGEPSLVELARAPGQAEQRALLVVYPRSWCSGTASVVLVDEDGSFVGAVAPGTAALLSVPSDARSLFAISSVEIAAPLHASSELSKVVLPAQPAGLLFRSRQWSNRDCATGQYADPATASKAELEAVLAEEEIRWIEPRRREGQAWLDAHRDRVREVIATAESEDDAEAP